VGGAMRTAVMRTITCLVREVRGTSSNVLTDCM
jgi:hypothetical protein